MEFVGEFVAGAAASGFGGIAALEHEVFDYAVKGNAVVVTTLGEVQKVRAGDGCFRSVEGGLDVTGAGVHGYFNVVHRLLFGVFASCS